MISRLRLSFIFFESSKVTSEERFGLNFPEAGDVAREVFLELEMEAGKIFLESLTGQIDIFGEKNPPR